MQRFVFTFSTLSTEQKNWQMIEVTTEHTLSLSRSLLLNLIILGVIVNGTAKAKLAKHM